MRRRLTPEQSSAFRTVAVFGRMLDEGHGTPEIMATLELTAEAARELVRNIRDATRQAGARIDHDSALARVLAAIDATAKRGGPSVGS